MFSREQILTHVLGDDISVTDRIIDTHICLIRKKLGKYKNVIESIFGEGYRFDPEKFYDFKDDDKVVASI